MATPTPSPPLPIPPPLASTPFTEAGTGMLTRIGLTFMQLLWAAIQGGGGVLEQTATIFGMSGDATISPVGVVTITPGAVTTPKLADDAVTTAKIADGAVTTPKLADGSVTTGKVADKNITYGKIQDVADARLLGRAAGSNGQTQEISVATGLFLASGVLSPYIYIGTVGALPSAGSSGQGARAFVTDASAPTFAAAVSGGGAVKCPVYSDGSTWLAG